MKEKYESLPLATLRDLAKARGMKKISSLKKADLILRMLEEDEKEAAAKKEIDQIPAPAAEASAQDMEQPKEAEAPKEAEVKTEPEKKRTEPAADQPAAATAHGILEVMADGFGFIRCENYLPGENDVYVSPSLIRRFNLKTGDIITGNKKEKTQGDKFSALLFISDVNGIPPFEAAKRPHFEDLTPIFPNERIRLERKEAGISMRIMDLIAPVGKG